MGVSSFYDCFLCDNKEYRIPLMQVSKLSVNMQADFFNTTKVKVFT